MARSEHVDRQYNKWQWFLFVILIPTIFAITLTFVILTIVGVNVFKLADGASEKLPFLSTIDNEDRNLSSEDIVILNGKIEEKKLQIAKLERELKQKDDTINGLEQEVIELQAMLTEAEQTRKSQVLNISEVASSYASMDPKEAAIILSRLDVKTAANILLNLKTNERGKILEKMDANKAAEITKQLLNES